MNKPIAIIPARGNSKRIPDKNIVEFNGKPLIQWTIEAAINSKAFDRVYVSTDSEKIAEVSQKAGAVVPFLREQYADDQSTVSQATAWFVAKLLAEGNINENGAVVQLMANCPIRQIATIQSFVSFAQAQSSSVISVVEPKFGNPFWAMTKDNTEKGRFLFNEYAATRSQDLPQHFYPTGSLWFSKVATLMEEKTFYSSDYRVFEIPWLEAIDIDTPEELNIAACLHRGKLTKPLH